MSTQKANRPTEVSGGSNRAGIAVLMSDNSKTILAPSGPAVNADLSKLIDQAARLTALHLAAGRPDLALRHLVIGRALASLVEGEGEYGT